MLRMKMNRKKAGMTGALLLLTLVMAVGAGSTVLAQSDTVTQYGFYMSSPEATVESVLQHFIDMSEHGDFVLLQPNVPWADFDGGIEGASQSRTEIATQVNLARLNDLDYILVADPLNGLNRREFVGLPEGWNANFANPDVRAAFSNFALWMVRQFHPAYLGLAVEINTYMDAYPDDAPNFVSLYHEVYAAVKAEAPETQIFVTFQWDDLNNMWPGAAEGRQPYEINWDQVELFEPNLDLWVISTYPYTVFKTAADIPDDYYTPLLERTDKPLAVAEGGYSSTPIMQFSGSPDDQVIFLNRVHDQIGGRLAFWNYTTLNDINMESYSESMRGANAQENDIVTLSAFQFIGLREVDGTPRPALGVWDAFRGE